MRLYNGPLPLFFRQYRDRIIAARVEADGKFCAYVTCARKTCGAEVNVLAWLNGEITCGECSFFSFDGFVNTDRRLQAYAAQVSRAVRRRYGKNQAELIVWYFFCASADCKIEIYESTCWRHGGFCKACRDKTTTVDGIVLGRQFEQYARIKKLVNFVRIVRPQTRIGYIVRCTQPHCEVEATVYVFDQAKDYRCKGCRKRGEPFSYWYRRAKIDATDRKIDVFITLKDYQVFCRANSCFYCHKDLCRVPYVFMTKKRKGWSSHCMDRIDSKKPYRKENILPCCSQCNFRKGAHLTVRDALALGMAHSYGMSAGIAVMSWPESKILQTVRSWQATIWSEEKMNAPPNLRMDWDAVCW